MKTPVNGFKLALASGRPQIGFWLAMGDVCSAEISAGAGFQWLVIDGEHGPHDLRSILAQLQAISAYPECHAVVRVPVGDPTTIKQYLDLGAMNVLVPMVDSPEQAAAAVCACRYPPDGIRGVGLTRASRWGRYPHHFTEANDQICVLVQAETPTALENVEEISRVDGIDGVFIGIADLAAAMGYPGQSLHPTVQEAALDAMRRVRAAGKPVGVLTPVEEMAHRYLDSGAVFVSVGIDAHLLATGAANLASRFRIHYSKDGAPSGAHGDNADEHRWSLR
jgi:4-hydroxy-2-oxoheptanedioate aldolase